jgi:hypothetical protein
MSDLHPGRNSTIGWGELACELADELGHGDWRDLAHEDRTLDHAGLTVRHVVSSFSASIFRFGIDVPIVVA